MDVVNLQDTNARLESRPKPGKFITVPRGVEDCPKALTDGVHVVLIEPKMTLNIGNVVSERTVRNLERI